MKRLLIMLLFTITTFSQTTTPIKGVTLKYNKKTKTMILSMSDKTFLVEDNSDLDTEVKIVREYDLSMKINGIEYSMTEPYFWTYGYRHEMSWFFVTEKPSNSKIIGPVNGPDYNFKFTKVEPGEYILIVTTRCDEKYIIEKLTTSLIIR